jgi:signal transduction histidine kinase
VRGTRAIVALLVAFAAVVVAFVGSTILAQRASREVRDLSLSISRDAAPGFSTMSSIRAELRRLQALVQQRAAGAPRETLGEQIDDARRRLDEALLRYQSLPTSAEEVTLLRMLQTEVRAFDEAAERTLEHARAGRFAEAQHSAVADLLPLADGTAATAQLALDLNAREAEEAAAKIEQVHQRAERFAMQLDAVSVLVAVAAAIAAVGVVRQMHRLQHRHQEVLERRAAELEEFAGRVAHDVLSPLASVGVALSLAEKSSSPLVQTAAQRGTASLQRVRGIVDALLDFARSGASPDPGAICDVPSTVGPFLDEMQQQANEAGVELRADPIPPCTVACAPGVVIVLVSNLLRNAFKYIGDVPVRVVQLRIRVRRSTVLFEVEDSGRGIPPELGERIFEPYVRGRDTGGKRGIGLGLATVQRLVTAHGGTVGTRRGALGGALFWFELVGGPVEGQEGVRPDVRSPGSPAASA